MSEPRTWSIPDEPTSGTKIVDRDGQTWTLDGELWFLDGGTTFYAWPLLLAKRGPLTEVVETEVEAAARRLRESEFDKRGMVRLSRDYANASQDIHVVLVHVLNGGTL